MKKVIGLVQVHMSSKRLPGKVLADIAGRPMAWHIVNRLRHARLLHDVVIAVPDEPVDEPIRRMADSESIPYYAGSESDMIDRIYQTAVKFEADAVVRITGDCPLVDPDVVDWLVETFLEEPEGLDYISNVRPPTFPHGIGAEVYPMETLEKLWHEIEDPFYREWFPVYFWERESEYRTCNVEYPLNLSHFRWTVDYKEDLDFVREVYDHLYKDGEVFGMAEVLELIYSRPDIEAINSIYPCDNGFQRALEEQAVSPTARGGRSRRQRTPESVA